MERQLKILQAMQYCQYKAWRLSKENHIEDSTGEQGMSPGTLKQIQQSSEQLEILLKKDQPPPFFKIPHCSACHYKDDCLQKLKGRDCISLLAGMTAKVMAKYHNKGITTITQLSYLFKPRRKRAANPQSSYLWELKALAIREQKTFVMEAPSLSSGPTAIYIDFEGTTDENHIYLLGALITENGKPVEKYAFWSDHKQKEETIFKELFALLQRYPETAIYHYGSYETKALKQAVKKWPKLVKHWPAIEKRVVNLLGYLRTHVYPPTYSNGLKELGAFLNFKWDSQDADGFLSMEWRRQWQETGLESWKEKLIRYNGDDCQVLYHVHQWFQRLAAESEPDKVQQIANIKKYTPYHLQSNLDYGEDFQSISKAAYFDYQRNKIYWRNELKRNTPAADQFNLKPKQTRKGTIAWQPKQINEIIIVPPLKKCPHCGHTKLYQSRMSKTAVKQTDLKFTASGVRQYVTEYRSGTAKCAKCYMKTGNKNLRMMHYGDNLFALVINYYVSYHISNELISKLIQEHYGIWISPMYLVMYKNRWWLKNWLPVADYIRKIVLNSPVIHIDETTIKLAKMESGYVWVFATTHTVFYHYAPSREVGFLQELLKDYKGIIVSDFYPGYDTLNVRSQKCLIHLIRDLNDDLFKNQFDQEYKILVAAFNKLLRRIVETIDKHGLKKVHLNRHCRDKEDFYREFVDRPYQSELAARYSKRFKKHWAQLWTFLDHDNVPWNNNNAEAAVKAFALHRRGVKGQMHVRGITEYLQMLTVAQTCRYRNISFLSFLRKKKGIWENVAPEALPGFLPFDQARLFVSGLNLGGTKEWNDWKQSGQRPAFIPSAPDKSYKEKGWADWQDWFGTGFLPFTKARTYVRKQQLKNRAAYKEWLASGQRPRYIPAVPEKEYKHTGWAGLKDYLGIKSEPLNI
jgi:hypothetical protein